MCPPPVLLLAPPFLLPLLLLAVNTIYLEIEDDTMAAAWDELQRDLWALLFMTSRINV